MLPNAVQELKKVVVLRDVPDVHLQWIAEHSEYWEYKDGDIIMKTGEVPEFMMFIVEGVASFYMDKNGNLVHYFDFANDEATGGATGLLPYSRMKKSPGVSYAVGKLRSFRMHKSHFVALEQLNPDLIQRLIGYMTERARSFATIQLQHEKINALGKLAAGIAHEMNNPAAAINRISSELAKRLKLNYSLTEKMQEFRISKEFLHNIRLKVEEKEAEQKNGKKLRPIERLELEDAINDWLDDNGFHESYIAGETFVEAGFAEDDLENIKQDTDDDSFVHVLQWMENLLSSQKIIKDLEEASSRISHLVGAIKSHVHMDQANDLQLTNIHTDIENTLTLMGYKLRAKNINVNKLFCENMPEVPAYVGELNQVWTNIIDNAIDALSKDGELTIETSCNNKNVVTKITDNGMGIPPEIISRIFDPFFTTKKMGEGTGIGLDLVNRVIKHHNGSIKVRSKPGETEFEICIPVTPLKND